MTLSKRLNRTSQQAFVLHHYAHSESSAIVELLTRERGRVTAIAKGAKKPTSNFRAVLLPFQLVRVDYAYVENEATEICNIRGIERVGGAAMPTGENLLAGLYLNELMLRVLGRADPHLGLFDAFNETIQMLCSQQLQSLASLLRAFELVLLHQLGLLPELSLQTQTQMPLLSEKHYVWSAQFGLHLFEEGKEGRPKGACLPSQTWLALHEALLAEHPVAHCVQILGKNAGQLKQPLREALSQYAGRELQTQRLMRNLRAL